MSGSLQLAFKFHLLFPAYLECFLIGSRLLNTLPHSRGRRFPQFFQWLLFRSENRLNVFWTTHWKHWRLMFQHVCNCEGALAEVATFFRWFPPHIHILLRSDVFEQLWFDCLLGTKWISFRQFSKRCQIWSSFYIEVLFIIFDFIRKVFYPLNAIKVNVFQLSVVFKCRC